MGRLLTRPCRECRKEFQCRTYNRAFCGATCRKVWNNRRARRGAHLYDLAMLRRFEPGKLEAVQLSNAVVEAAMNVWHADDTSHGRKRSWLAANEVAMQPLPI